MCFPTPKVNDLQVVRVTAPSRNSVIWLCVWWGGGGGQGQGQGLVRDSCAQGDSSTPVVGSTQFRAWFSDRQDGHCVRVCRDAESQAPLQILRIRTYRGLCPLWKCQKLCSKADAVLGQSRSKLRSPLQAKHCLDDHEPWIGKEALFQNLPQPIHLVCRAAAVTQVPGPQP